MGWLTDPCNIWLRAFYDLGLFHEHRIPRQGVTGVVWVKHHLISSECLVCCPPDRPRAVRETSKFADPGSELNVKPSSREIFLASNICGSASGFQICSIARLDLYKKKKSKSIRFLSFSPASTNRCQCQAVKIVSLKKKRCYILFFTSDEPNSLRKCAFGAMMDQSKKRLYSTHMRGFCRYPPGHPRDWIIEWVLTSKMKRLDDVDIKFGSKLLPTPSGLNSVASWSTTMGSNRSRILQG